MFQLSKKNDGLITLGGFCSFTLFLSLRSLNSMWICSSKKEITFLKLFNLNFYLFYGRSLLHRRYKGRATLKDVVNAPIRAISS